MKEVYKKCSFTVTPCVWIKFKGDTTNKIYPQLPEDGGLALDFLKWCLDEKIYSIDGLPGTTGPGLHSHGYSPDDAKKIIEWFKNKGIPCELP